MSLDLFLEWTAYFGVKSDYEKWVQKQTKLGLPTTGFFG